MNPPRESQFASRNGSGTGEPGETLRLIANLPAPEGLEERVKIALQLKQETGHVLPWPMERMGTRTWTNNPWARSAAAAAIVFVVAGGSWSVYSRVQPALAPKAIVLPHVQSSGGFSNAGAMRTPQTLNGPQVKRPMAGATKHARTANAESHPAPGHQAHGKTHPAAKPAQ